MTIQVPSPPARQIWYRSALPWVPELIDVPHVERQ
jgi:hypothetical protein